MAKLRCVVRVDGSIVTIIRPSEKFRLLGESDDALLDRAATLTIQKNPRYQGFTTVDIEETDMPTTRRFRNAWGRVGAKLEVDMPKARTQRLAEIRKDRDKLLDESDKDILRDQEQGGAKQAALRAYRQALRDLPTTLNLDAILTPEALNTFRPTFPVKP